MQLQLTRNDILVMNILYKNECNNYIKAYSCRKIAEELNSVSYYTVRSIVKTLNLAGILREGAKNGKNFSYYITEDGIRELEKLKLNLLKGDEK